MSTAAPPPSPPRLPPAEQSSRASTFPTPPIVIVTETPATVTNLTLNDVTVNEGAGTATISATIDNAPTTGPLVLALDNGATLTFAVGATTATSSAFAVQADDAYVNGGTTTVSASITSGGAEFESLNVSDTADVIVTETPATVTNLTLNDVTVNEGAGTATISATIDNAPTTGPLVLALDNGATLTFAVGATTATSSAFAVQADDAYVNGGTTTVSASITSGGAEFESLNVSDTADVIVTETPATVTNLTLNDVTVNEGAGTATISATIDNAPTTGPLVLALDNGATLTFAVGATTATSSAFAVQADDAYVNGGTTTVSASITSGGAEFESLNVSDTADVIVTETPATVTNLTLNDVTVNEGAGTATISATIDNAPTTGPLVLALDNGATLTFAVGATTATSSAFAVQADDAYVNGGTTTVSASITSGGAEFESLNVSDTADVIVTETPATVTNLTLNDVTVNEGAGTATISATIDNAPTTGPLVLALDNGATLTFAVGATTATSSAFAVQADDAYVNGGTTTVSASITSGGAEFESLNVSDTADVIVTETPATVTNLTLNDVTVNEGAGTATISATIDNAPTTGPLVLALDNGATLTFAVGATTATSSAFAVQADDAYVNGGTTTVSASITSGGAEFESLNVSDTADVIVTETPATVTNLTLNDVTVNEGAGTATISATIDNAPTTGPLVLALDNGATLTFAVGATTATSSAFAVQADDAYVNGGTTTVSASITSGGAEFESLNVSDTADVIVTETPATVTNLTLNDVTVNEGAGTATISATIDNAPTTGPLVLALDNGATLTFAVGATTATSSAFAVQADDAYVNGGTTTVSASITSGGAEFESLNVSDTADVIVTETPATVTNLTLNDVTVNEGAGTATISATIDNAPTTGPLVLALDNGATLTFAVGATTATSSAFAVQADDAYVNGGTTTVSASITSGGAEFESLNVSDTADVIVTETRPRSPT